MLIRIVTCFLLLSISTVLHADDEKAAQYQKAILNETGNDQNKKAIDATRESISFKSNVRQMTIEQHIEDAFQGRVNYYRIYNMASNNVKPTEKSSSFYTQQLSFALRESYVFGEMCNIIIVNSRGVGNTMAAVTLAEQMEDISLSIVQKEAKTLKYKATLAWDKMTPELREFMQNNDPYLTSIASGEVERKINDLVAKHKNNEATGEEMLELAKLHEEALFLSDARYYLLIAIEKLKGQQQDFAKYLLALSYHKNGRALEAKSIIEKLPDSLGDDKRVDKKVFAKLKNATK